MHTQALPKPCTICTGNSMKSDTERHDAFKCPNFQEKIGIAMALTDPQGRFLDCNAVWCAMLGYSQADL
jgi:PAS domain-containing protein